MPNETITGKIYPVWNADKSERRFPQTVIEAVLGLPTYLQDQFSALADIYMPIEGITETKQGQEFVYRKTPNTIKAKSLTLDRIYGKTLAWNQLIGNDTPIVVSGLSGEITVTKNNDGSITLNGDATADREAVYKDIPIALGHKVLASISHQNSNIRFGDGYTLNDYGDRVYLKDSVQLNRLYIYIKSGASFSNLTVSFNYIDLTLMFGAGNEPSTVAEFEALYPGYHDFGNKLISNDASAIETVGFNKWDEEWENGYYSSSMGNKEPYDEAIRAKNPIHILPNTSYYLKTSLDNNSYGVCFYDENESFLGSIATGPNSIFTTPANACYLTWYYFGVSELGTAKICINLSDPAKNGTYEPYRKTTLQLNLGSFQVRDSQGNITTITGGLKGDGTWADILYSNNHLTNKAKRVNLGDLDWIITYDSQSNVIFYTEGLSSLIKPTLNDSLVGNIICSIYSTRSRDGEWGSGDNMVIAVNSSGHIFVNNYSYTDAATFKTAMSGVYLDYELATPIEYELVEPLVYSMAAGTTEERISPNTDGLSAPFCCDMTYDANANNDSANAQYAATAGRLYNTHKLWGRDFDGSNDVSGALSGVTTIGASGNITTAAQLISTVATGTAPLSVASTTEVANLHSYTATKLHTQRTLWGRDFDGSGNVTGDMSSVGNIAFSASGKNIASLLYFDTVNSRVGVGASSPAYKLDVNGTLNASGDTTLGGTLGVIGNTTIGGNLFLGGTTNYATFNYVHANLGTHTDKGFYSDSFIDAGQSASSSDARLKSNIKNVVSPFSILSKLTPREWVWNEKSAFEGQMGAGLVAQETEPILPFSVVKHGEYLALNYDVLHAYEIAGLQELESRVRTLERENKELKQKLNLN